MLNLFKLCWHKVSGGSRDDVGRFTVSCTSIQFLCLIFLVSCPIFVDKCRIAIRGKRISNIRGGANPVSLRSTAPSKGRGENVWRFECIDPSFLWKEVPAGRRLGAQSGVKKERLKSTIYGSTRAPLTRSPFPDGEGLGGATLRVNFYEGRCPKVGFQSLVTRH